MLISDSASQSHAVSTPRQGVKEIAEKWVIQQKLKQFRPHTHMVSL